MAASDVQLGALVPDRFYEALGLGDNMRISELTLTIRMSDAVLIRYKELLLSDGIAVVEQEVQEPVTEGQMGALADAVHDVTARGDHGWRARRRRPPEVREWEASLDGPMERLARAVLAGDVKSALVLADRVQEIWGAYAKEGP